VYVGSITCIAAIINYIENLDVATTNATQFFFSTPRPVIKIPRPIFMWTHRRKELEKCAKVLAKSAGFENHDFT
jgi:hypothetical protein